RSVWKPIVPTANTAAMATAVQTTRRAKLVLTSAKYPRLFRAALLLVALGHRDPLHQCRVVLEPEIRPERRVRVLEARLLEAPEEPRHRRGIVGRLQRAPVRLGLVAARDLVLQR